MNKEGFTLVELIAVIAILAMLSLIVTPSVIAIRKNVLQSSLKSKITMINTAAKDYASNHIMEIPSFVNDTSLSESENCIARTGLKKSSTTDKDDLCYDNCKIVLVKTLISNGYLVGEKEDKTILLHPFTNQSMNNEEVCIRYDNNDAMNRKIVAYVVGEKTIIDENE